MSNFDPTEWNMPYGEHEGKTFDKLPIKYIKWMANSKSHGMKKYALLELQRRVKVAARIKARNKGH